MHALARREGASAASRRWKAGDRARPSVPSRPAPRAWRRVIMRCDGRNMIRVLGMIGILVAAVELGGVEDRPQHVFESGGTFASLHQFQHGLALLLGRPPRQGGKEQP